MLDQSVPAGERLERLTGAGLAEGRLEAAVDDIVSVLVGAFGVDPERRPGVAEETAASLVDPRFTHYLIRLDGTPVAAARRATFDGLSYLSSIGTLEGVRGAGLGRRMMATAMADGFAAGSDIVHLGVFADNAPAIALYRRLGLVPHGDPGPDMVLIG